MYLSLVRRIPSNLSYRDRIPVAGELYVACVLVPWQGRYLEAPWQEDVGDFLLEIYSPGRRETGHEILVLFSCGNLVAPLKESTQINSVSTCIITWICRIISGQDTWAPLTEPNAILKSSRSYELKAKCDEVPKGGKKLFDSGPVALSNQGWCSTQHF